MTLDAAVLAFTLEVARASSDVDLPEPPPVVLVDLPSGILAETVPGEIRLAIHAAQAARDLRRPKSWLRCIARHEVAHRRLGHNPTTREGFDEAEAQAALLLRARWNERDPHCEAHLR